MKTKLQTILSACGHNKLLSIAVIRLAMKGNPEPYARMMDFYRPEWYNAKAGIIELLDTYERERFSTGAHPIKVEKDMKPIDGHHRIAYASLHGIEVVTVEVDERNPSERRIEGDWITVLGLDEWRDEIAAECSELVG
jgi:hypothetical protein